MTEKKDSNLKLKFFLFLILAGFGWLGYVVSQDTPPQAKTVTKIIKHDALK